MGFAIQSVVNAGFDLADDFSRDTRRCFFLGGCGVDNQSCDFLSVALSHDVCLFGVASEALSPDDFLREPEKCTDVDVRVVCGKYEIIGVSRVRPAEFFGESTHASVESHTDDVCDGRAGGGTLWQAPVGE